MMASVPQFGAIFASVQNAVKTSSGSAVNIVICLVTVGSEQLFSFATFICPCSQTTMFAIPQNVLYGWVFILVPAFALFILGCAMNTKTWKLATGCRYRHKEAERGYLAGLSTVVEISAQALVAPVAWSSVAFLDGKYYACAETVIPYEEECNLVKYVYKPKMTSEFEANKRASQIIGWVIIAGTLLLGSVFYCVYRCGSPLTYHHRRYMNLYREIESKAFEAAAKVQIEDEVKNETTKRFFQKKRGKEDWDKISTVYTFKRDEENYALYSRLDELNEEIKKTEPLIGEEPLNNITLADDDSSLDLIARGESKVEVENNPSGTAAGSQSKSGRSNGVSKISKTDRSPIRPPPDNANRGKRLSADFPLVTFATQEEGKKANSIELQDMNQNREQRGSGSSPTADCCPSQSHTHLLKAQCTSVHDDDETNHRAQKMMNRAVNTYRRESHDESASVL